MHELAREPPVRVLPEVAVLEQHRNLEWRPLGKVQLALTPVANDPQARQPRVHGKPRTAQHVVVVPEQRRTLVHRIVADRVLARSRDVLRPAVVSRRVSPPCRCTTVNPVSAAACRSATPPLSPGRHCTGTPSPSVSAGATVTTTGNAPSSSLRHSTRTGQPRSASIVGPGTLPSNTHTRDGAGRGESDETPPGCERSSARRARAPKAAAAAANIHKRSQRRRQRRHHHHLRTSILTDGRALRILFLGTHRAIGSRWQRRAPCQLLEWQRAVTSSAEMPSLLAPALGRRPTEAAAPATWLQRRQTSSLPPALSAPCSRPQGLI